MSSNRSFGFVFFIVFFVIAFWSYNGEFHDVKIVPFCFSLVFLILGLLNSNILTPFNRLWFKFGILLGSIIAPIVMGVIFFLVVTPIGAFMRLLGNDLLKMRKVQKTSTYWIKRGKQQSTMRKQF